MSNYTYLFLNLIIIIVPLALTYYPTLHFYRRFKPMLLVYLFVSLPFIFWDYFFTKYKIWSFNSEYITGIKLLGLPLEEILFFFTVPYACIFLYETIRFYLPERKIKVNGIHFALATAIMLLLIALYPTQVYTGIVVGLALVILLAIKHSLLLSSYYYLYLLASLLGFLLINGILTALPVVTYDPANITNIRIGSIPLEDFFYLFLMNTSCLIVYLTSRTNWKHVKKK